MSAQVRSGIQGLLGIPVLRELAIGLGILCEEPPPGLPCGFQHHPRQAGNRTRGAEQQARDGAGAPGRGHAQLVEHVTGARANHSRARQLWNRFTGQFQEQLSSLARYNAEAERAQEALYGLLGSDIALGLAAARCGTRSRSSCVGSRSERIGRRARHRATRTFSGSFPCSAPPSRRSIRCLLRTKSTALRRSSAVVGSPLAPAAGGTMRSVSFMSI